MFCLRRDLDSCTLVPYGAGLMSLTSWDTAWTRLCYRKDIRILIFVLYFRKCRAVSLMLVYFSLLHSKFSPLHPFPMFLELECIHNLSFMFLLDVTTLCIFYNFLTTNPLYLSTCKHVIHLDNWNGKILL